MVKLWCSVECPHPIPTVLKKPGKWNKTYLQAARDWNSNVVRFPVHPAAWRERGEQGFLIWLDDDIKWAGELGMNVIIDWHSIGNLRTEVFQAPIYNTSNAETYRFLRTIAARYKDIPVIGDETYGEAIIGFFKKKMTELNR